MLMLATSTPPSPIGMPRISITSIAVVLAVLAGCRSAPQSATTSASDSRHDLDLRGDFKGPLGVQLYSVRDAIAKDVSGTLARVRALGFREVELAGTYGLSASQFRAELDRAGLRATSMHVGYERLRDSLPAVLDEARTLGVQYVGTAWIPHNDGPLSEDGARRAAADFNAWGRSAQQQGLQFFYHVHGYEFQPGPSGALAMDVLMRETAPDAVKFEMDVFWISRPGADPVAWLRKYPTRWRLLHLKDMKQGTATNVNTGSANPDETEVPLGTGQIDYRGVLRAAREIGVEKYFVEDETREPFATMPLTVRWLETLRY
jgi:sugar phosphate isomerase/epimerase